MFSEGHRFSNIPKRISPQCVGAEKMYLIAWNPREFRIICAWFYLTMIEANFLNDFIVRPLGLYLRLSKALNKIVPVFH